MNEKLIVAIGLMLPFLGTIIGSVLVFFCKNKQNISFQKFFLGLAAGIMLAASIWSLIIPAIELCERIGKFACFPVSIGIILGVLFLFFMEKMIIKSSKTNLLNFAITLHNIPEGMAVGVAFASAITSSNELLLISAVSMSVGIAIQNIPEGMAIALPYNAEGKGKLKAFLYGSLSGIVEPIFGILTLIISNFIANCLPVLLGFAAGSMIYVVVKELIPETQIDKYSNFGLSGTILGFLIMMILDVMLG